MTKFDSKTDWKPLKLMILTVKSLILINFTQKNSPSGGQKRWLRLRRPTVSGLNGAEMLGKTSEINEFHSFSENLGKFKFYLKTAHLIDTWSVRGIQILFVSLSVWTQFNYCSCICIIYYCTCIVCMYVCMYMYRYLYVSC